jgi:hypothetical protein
MLFYLFLLIILFLTFIVWKMYKRSPNITKAVKYLSSQPIDKIKPTDMVVLSQIKQYGKFGIDKNIGESKKLLYNAISKLTSTGDDAGLAYMSLAKIRYESLDAYGAIQAYTKAIEWGYEEAIIQIGKIYCYGLHPFYLPDKIMAGKIFTNYSYISERLRKWSNLYIQEIMDVNYSDLDTIPLNGIRYKQLPVNIIELIDNAIRIKGGRGFVPFVAFFDNQWLRVLKEETCTSIIPTQPIYNDGQNVHDHVVSNTAKVIVDLLNKDKKEGEGDSFGEDKSECLNIIKNDKQSTNFLKTLNSLGALTHSKYNLSERQIFSLVWNKIKHDTSLIDVFVENIESSVEEDFVVCSTGKIMRMLSTLDLIHDSTLPTLKPEWAIKGEIGQKISIIITKTLDSLGYKYKVAFNEINPSDDQILLSKKVKDVVEKEIIIWCRESYVQSGIISEEMMTMYLDDFLKYI